MRICMRISMRMARPTTGETGKPVNLYLNTALREAARKLAAERYGTSLSGLVERLLRHEISLKRGKLHRAA